MSSSLRYTYRLVTFQEANLVSAAWRHCAHIMIYSALPEGTCLFNNPKTPISHAVMMQMRFDGRLGFPGGFIDASDKTIEDGLYRELKEEMGELPPAFEIRPQDHLSTHLCEEKKYCLHFYGKEVTFDQFLDIEKRNGEQLYCGFEVLGVLRVPLFAMHDKRGGFPAFLRNNFIGIAKEQLISGLLKCNIISKTILDEYLALSKKSDPLSDAKHNEVL